MNRILLSKITRYNCVSKITRYNCVSHDIGFDIPYEGEYNEKVMKNALLERFPDSLWDVDVSNIIFKLPGNIWVEFSFVNDVERVKILKYLDKIILRNKR